MGEAGSKYNHVYKYFHLKQLQIAPSRYTRLSVRDNRSFISTAEILEKFLTSRITKECSADSGRDTQSPLLGHLLAAMSRSKWTGYRHGFVPCDDLTCRFYRSISCQLPVTSRPEVHNWVGGSPTTPNTRPSKSD